MRFREWLGQMPPEGQAVPPGQPSQDQPVIIQGEESFKPWRASREEILSHWDSLGQEPVTFRPIADGHKGSTFTEDGIRFTGTRKFIDSCLGRFKDLLAYENQATKLDVVWRQIGPKTRTVGGNEIPTFVFYLYVRDRKPGQPMEPSTPMPGDSPTDR